MKTLAINPGNANIKVATAEGVYAFPSRIKKVSALQDMKKRCIINQVHYEIGVGPKNIDNKLINLTHKYCTYYAIASHSQDKEHINLYLTLPLKDYLDKTFRSKYLDYILGERHAFSIALNNEEEKTIYIDHADVKPEAVTAVMNNMELFSNKLMGLLDIGGGTINGAIFDDGKIVPESILPLDTGISRLERTVIDTLNLAKHSNIQDYELPYLFSSDSNLLSSDEYLSIIKPLIDEYILSLRQSLLSKSWNIEMLPLFFTGGGSLFCKSSIIDVFPNTTISPEPLFDTVKGLWRLSQVTQNE